MRFLPKNVGPKRWTIERPFAWLAKSRRLDQDYEVKIENSTAFILHRRLNTHAPQARFEL